MHCDAALVSDTLNKHEVRKLKGKNEDKDQQLADLTWDRRKRHGDRAGTGAVNSNQPAQSDAGGAALGVERAATARLFRLSAHCAADPKLSFEIRK